MVSRQGVGRGSLGGHVRGRRGVHAVSSRASMSEGRSMAVLEDDGNRTNVEGE